MRLNRIRWSWTLFVTVIVFLPAFLTYEILRQRVYPWGEIPAEFAPLWKDDYPIPHSPDWPAPKGSTPEQRKIIETFDRAWIATILYPQKRPPEAAQFHGARVLAFREITSNADKQILRAEIQKCYDQLHIEDYSTYMVEGYPQFGVRLESKNGILDVTIESETNHMVYLYSPSDERFMFMPKGSRLPNFLRQQTARMPTASSTY